MLSVTSFFISLTCCLLSGQVKSEDSCNIVQKYGTVLSGYYTNYKQYVSSNGSVDFVIAAFTPAEVAHLQADYVFFLLETINLHIQRFELRVATEAGPDTIKVDHYKIVNSCNITSHADLEHFVSTLTQDDIELIEDCEVTIIYGGGDYFYGYRDVCINDQAIGYYKFDLTCAGFNASIPENAPEQAGLEPYSMIRWGPRLQIPGAPESCASICPEPEQP